MKDKLKMLWEIYLFGWMVLVVFGIHAIIFVAIMEWITS